MAPQTNDQRRSTLVEIRLFGGMAVVAGGEIVQLGLRARALLAFLVLHPHNAHRRELLVEMFWPGVAPSQARRALSDQLYRLRQAIAGEWLIADGERVGLAIQHRLWVDVWEFERLAASAEPPDQQRACALYTGELLPESYDDWLLARRVALHERYLACLERRAAAAEPGDPVAALAAYRQIVAADPLYEPAYCGIMRCLARSGRLAEALATYSRLEATLAAELATRPAPASQTLAEQLRSEHELAASGPAGRQTHFVQPPFVGRVAQRRRLIERLEAAGAGQGGILVLLGMAGIGKTRLLEELVAAATWRGWQVAWGSGEELAPPRPYEPLGSALATALPPPRRQQIARLVAPVWPALLAQVMPALQELAGRANQPVAAAPPDRARIVTALSRVLGGLQQINPCLLILDNAQWSDPALWPLLQELADQLTDRRLLLVIAGRIDEIRRLPAAAELVAYLDKAGAPPLALSGLTHGELADLVRAAGQHDIAAKELEQLEIGSGGNPLLVLNMLQTGAAAAETLPTLADLVRRRLVRLSVPARCMLQAAAVIGYRFAYALWEAVGSAVDVPAADLPALAGELERQGMLMLAENGYRFAHDTLRAVTVADLPVAERRRWHARILAALNPTNVPAATLLHHAEGAADRAAVARWALQAGYEALDSFAVQSAVDYFGRALDCLPAAERAMRLSAHLGRLRAWEMLAEREAQRQELVLVAELAAQLDIPSARAEVALQRVRFSLETGDFAVARQQAEAALALVDTGSDTALAAALEELLARSLRDLGDYAAARAAADRARTLYTRIDSAAGVASTTNLLGSLAWTLGEHRTAADYHARAADLFQALGDLFQEASALNNLGSACWGLGDYAAARQTHERALVLCRELGNRMGEGDNLDNLGGVAWVLGDYPTAIDYYQQALAIRRATDDGWGISISLGNLGSAYRLQGDLPAALAYYAEALQVNRALQRRRGEAYAEHGRGLALLDAGRSGAARQALTAAFTIRSELGERDNLIETRAALALVDLACGDEQAARAVVTAALADLTPADRAALRQWVHYVAARIYNAGGDDTTAEAHLAQACSAMFEIADTLAGADRDQFLQQVPLNRQLQAQLAAQARQTTVRLVRVTAPLGRKLTPADYVSVHWTISSPLDTVVADPVERRRQILLRLLAEAAAAGAAPTDADLAAALGVSRRTILRDMEQLAATGATLPTRRRR